jgi:hypothetical protein
MGNTENGSHPNIDLVLMIKILVLELWYNLSNQKMERELANNLFFMNFSAIQKPFLIPRPYGAFVSA